MDESLFMEKHRNFLNRTVVPSSILYKYNQIHILNRRRITKVQIKMKMKR